MANVYDYKNISQKEKDTKLEQARNNSIKTRNSNIIGISYKGKRYKISAERLKVTIVTSFLATALAVSGIVMGIGSTIDDIKEDIAVREALEQYENIIPDNTYRTNDNTGFWHQPIGVAKDILNAEDRDLAIYKVYKDIQFNRTSNMTDIFNEMDSLIRNNPEKYGDIPTYGGYQQYLRNLGCVDKKGNISMKKYEEKMDNYALSVKNLQKSENDIKK